MRRHLRPLRVRLAIAGFIAIYVPILILAIATLTVQTIEESSRNGNTVTESTRSSGGWGIVLVTAGLTAPVAATFSWWWAGRAIRPVSEAILIQEQLIEEASHELRTPLAILTNNAEVLLEHPEPTLDDYRQGLARSLATAEGMTETIDGLLVDARGRARSVALNPTDVTDLVSAVSDSMGSFAAANDVTLVVDPSATEHARIDAASVERAVKNLITNAISASPSGSVIGITVHPLPETIEIRVTDHGAGISAENQDLMFERYWQKEVDGDGGSGIGLDIVKQVAQAHGGDVSVTSPVADGAGSRIGFSVRR